MFHVRFNPNNSPSVPEGSMLTNRPWNRAAGKLILLSVSQVRLINAGQIGFSGQNAYPCAEQKLLTEVARSNSYVDR
jgi:hypothetical protein